MQDPYFRLRLDLTKASFSQAFLAVIFHHLLGICARLLNLILFLANSVADTDPGSGAFLTLDLDRGWKKIQIQDPG